VSRPGDALFHGHPAVLIAGCPHAPRLDRSGCIVGRVAAEDGSLAPPPRQVHDDDPVSRDWFLHAQCGPQATTPPIPPSATPARRVWLNYQSHTYSSDSRPTPAGAIADEGDGFISPFAIRLRSLRAEVAQIEVRDAAGRPGRPTRLELRLNDGRWPAAGWRARSTDAAALLLRFVTLDLPRPQSGELSAFYRQHTAAGRWPWMAERIRRIGRDVTIRVDLRTEGGRPAMLCRSYPITPLENLTADRCTIEAIVDRSSGWPIVARISRVASAANGARVAESITFEQLPLGPAALRVAL
jgi:hypothetical protein